MTLRARRRSQHVWTAMTAALVVTLAADAGLCARRVFGLVVGVNRASDQKVAALRYADDDAILFHQILATAGSSTLVRPRRLNGPDGPSE